MSSVIIAVLNSLWQALALALLVWAVLRMSKRMNAATRHAVWWVALAAVVALPAAPSLLEMMRGRSSAPAVRSDIGQLTIVTPAPTSVRIPVQARSRAGGPIEVRGDVWSAIIPVVWFVVLFLGMVRIGWSFRYVRRLKRRAVPAPEVLQRSFEGWLAACRIDRPVRLLASNDIVSPMAVGFFRPAVILPEALLSNFGPHELDHVLLHELAHVARRDDWTNLVARVAGAAVALHPIAAWMVRRIDREREIACDDWVVSMTGEPRPYAQSLTRLFEACWTRKRVLLASGMAGRPSQLGSRIEELLRRREFVRQASVAKVFMSVLALAAFGLAAAGTPRWIVFARSEQPAPRWEREREREILRPVKPKLIAQASRQRVPGTVQPAPVQPSPAPPAGGFSALVASGYGDLPVDEIINLKNAGVSADFLTAMSKSGWGRLPAQDLINLRNHGVSPDYAADVLDSGLKDATVSDVIQLRQHSVRPEFLREANALGFGPFKPREFIDLFTQGVRVEVLRALKEGGFVRASAREMIHAQQSGVRENHFREAKRFSSSLTLEQVIKLKHAGVLQ